jgi:serine phosphatase RsbU (regulator of sigma subunit)/GAF domain-containing protein
MPSVSLVNLNSPVGNRSFHEVALPVTIGRGSNNSVVLDDASVGRHHATIEVDGDAIVVVDHQSRNYTQVNGVRIERQPIKSGDILAFGNAQLRISIVGKPVPAALGNVLELQGDDRRVADLDEECRSIRTSLESTSVFCRNADARGLTAAVLAEHGQARTLLSRGFERFVIVDAGLGCDPESGRFEPRRFLAEVCRKLGESFRLELNPDQFHAADVFQVMKDEPPSLFCFLNFELVSEESLPLARAFTQGAHRSLFLNNREQSPADSEDRIGEESVFSESIVESRSASVENDALLKLKPVLAAVAKMAFPDELTDVVEKIATEAISHFTASRSMIVAIDSDSFHVLSSLPRSTTTEPNATRYSKTVARHCLENGQPIVFNDSATATLTSVVPPTRENWLYCPIQGPDNEKLGVLILIHTNPKKQFTPQDFPIAEHFTLAAGLAIEKAMMLQSRMTMLKMQREFEVARKIQLQFRPSQTPAIDGYSFYAIETAALGVGGDFAYYQRLGDGSILAVLGDVAGKGTTAGLILARLYGELSHAFESEPDLANAVARANVAMIRAGICDHFVTMIAMRLLPSDHRVQIVTAGHYSPRRIRSSDATFDEVMSLDQSGLPIGIMEDFEYAAIDCALEPGDRILAYTDGVLEAHSVSDKIFGENGIAAALGYNAPTPNRMDSKTICETLLTAVQSHSAGRSQYDDIGILCFGRNS